MKDMKIKLMVSLLATLLFAFACSNSDDSNDRKRILDMYHAPQSS